MEMLARVREIFKPAEEPTAHNLVISHATRMKINESINKRLALPGAKRVKAGRSSGLCEQQDMRLWPGLVLLGCLQRSRKGIRNGAPYTIASCGETTVSFQELPGHSFSYEEVRDCCRLSHAQTFASCQGTEFTESLTLWETEHPKFPWRPLFVGLSRGPRREEGALRL